MKKILIIAALATSIAAPIASTANAGWKTRTDYFGNTTIRGTGEHSGMRYKCRTDSFGNTTCR